MNEHLLEKIDRYLEGKMSEEEKAAFEAAAEGDEELSTLLAIYSGIETEMREQTQHTGQEATLRQTLGRLNTVYFTDVPGQGTEQRAGKTELYEPGKQKPDESAPGEEARAPQGKLRSMHIRRLLLVAAACIGIILIGVNRWHAYKNNGGNNNQIVRKKDSPSVPVVPGIQPDTQTLVQQNRSPRDKEDHPERRPAPPGNPDNRPYTAQQRPSLHPMDRMAHTNPLSPAIDNTALFAANFERDITVPADKPDALEIALDYYEHGDYKEAAEAFRAEDRVSRGGGEQTRSEEEEKKLTAFYRNYYLAQIYLKDNSAPKALSLLQTALQQSPDNSWKTKTQWYLALAHLKNGELQQAMDLLEKVSRQTQNATLRQKAGAILAEIKKS